VPGRRFRRDPLKAEIRGYEGLVWAVHKKTDRAIRYPLDPEVEWWTLVALRSAGTGAAVAVGLYASVLQRSGLGDRAAMLKILVSDPSLDLSVAFEDRARVRSAYRVVLWAHMAAITAELWPAQYEREMRAAARVLEIESPQEEAVMAAGSTLARAGENDWVGFDQEVLAAVIAATTGIEPPTGVSSDLVDSDWLACCERGREAARTRMQRLCRRGLPTLDEVIGTPL
jgi:hypothetical protein